MWPKINQWGGVDKEKTANFRCVFIKAGPQVQGKDKSKVTFPANLFFEKDRCV
ncbi:MAG: hypothetical protein ACI81P_000559 [Neolewinella sp.]|jgi:hypothetical protein